MWWYHAAGLANVGYEERRALEKSTLRDTFYSYLFFMGTKVFDLTTAKKVILTWIRKPRPRTSVFISLRPRSTNGNDSVAQGFFMYVSHFYNCQDED